MGSQIADGIGHFVAKWQVREPEMRWAEVFCPSEEKLRFLAWGALLHELREALFELSDAHVASVKTAWWAEELIGLAQNRHRHPLTTALAGLPVSGSSLGRALLDQVNGETRSSDTMQAINLLLPLAQAVIETESALFAVTGHESAVRSLAIHWLLQRLPQGMAMDDQARIPMHLFARHHLTAAQLVAGQGEDLIRDWARELVEALPPSITQSALIRRTRVSFDRARLWQLTAGQGFCEPSAPATLLRAWRAARRF